MRVEVVRRFRRQGRSEIQGELNPNNGKGIHIV